LRERWALVTGSSSGIARPSAEKLAAGGDNLVLINGAPEAPRYVAEWSPRGASGRDRGDCRRRSGFLHPTETFAFTESLGIRVDLL